MAAQVPCLNMRVPKTRNEKNERDKQDSSISLLKKSRGRLDGKPMFDLVLVCVEIGHVRK